MGVMIENRETMSSRSAGILNERRDTLSAKKSTHYDGRIMIDRVGIHYDTDIETDS